MYIHTDIAGTAFIWTEVIVSCWIAGFMSAVRFVFTSRAGTIVLATCYKQKQSLFQMNFFTWNLSQHAQCIDIEC